MVINLRRKIREVRGQRRYLRGQERDFDAMAFEWHLDGERDQAMWTSAERASRHVE